jgi:hypothetical protein
MRKSHELFDIVSSISEYRGPEKGERRRKAEKSDGETEAATKIERLRALRLSRESPAESVED